MIGDDDYDNMCVMHGLSTKRARRRKGFQQEVGGSPEAPRLSFLASVSSSAMKKGNQKLNISKGLQCLDGINSC